MMETPDRISEEQFNIEKLKICSECKSNSSCAMSKDKKYYPIDCDHPSKIESLMNITNWKAFAKGFSVYLVWNRSFNWAYYCSANTLEEAKAKAIDIRDSGDGARVKKIQVIDDTTDKVVWNGWEE